MPLLTARRPRVALLLALLALLASAAGCPTLDAGQPIALVPDSDWADSDAAELERAARCWNLQFGTRLQLRGSAAQQVRFRYSDFVCLDAIGHSPARTDPTLPVRVFICPPEYTFPAQRGAVLRMTFLHELGHVLNIRSEGASTSSVMGWTINLPHRFSAEDRRLFGDSNPDFRQTPACETVDIWATEDHVHQVTLDCGCPRP